MTDKELIAELLASFEMYLFAIIHRAVNPSNDAELIAANLKGPRTQLIDAVEAITKRTEGKDA